MRQHRAVVLTFDQDRVLTLFEFATLAGISLVTLRRLIARGEGPTVTKLSTRRLGIRMRHAGEWLDARASNVSLGE
jgi:predicted DNA-binding transcriptional regulator AlpA